ncbi:RNA methyltransferase [Candidatus Woesearchaeota archaeon]|nr:RNA methyltransferase [Candidatus Woesearchaeota archaeon]
MTAIVLVEPETPGNVGAVARVMKNFNLKELILINPKCKLDTPEAIGRAMHGREILENAILYKSLEQVKQKYNLLIATTAKIGKDPHIVRETISLKTIISEIVNQKGICIIFGREASGLRNEELLQCDFLVTIPASKIYPVLNISHAVGVVCYEYFLAAQEEHHASHIKFATLKEKERAMLMLDEVLQVLPFNLEKKRETQRRVWKRLIGKSFLTNKEVYSLFGFFKRIKRGWGGKGKKVIVADEGKD